MQAQFRFKHFGTLGGTVAIPASKRWQLMKAIRASLQATDLTDIIPFDRWRLQTKLANRYQPFASGLTIAPVNTQTPPHENRTLEFNWGVAVAAVWPGDGGVAMTEDATYGSIPLAVEELITITFGRTGRRLAPAPMLALDTAFAAPNDFKFEGCYVVDGDALLDATVAQGYDGIAKIIVTRVILNKPDNSALGA